MPLWLQIGIGVLTFLTLLATTWRTVVRPLVRLASAAERSAPALEQLASDFPIKIGVATLAERLGALERGQARIEGSTDRCEGLLREHVKEQHHV